MSAPIGQQDAKYVYQAPAEFHGRHAQNGTNAPLILTIAPPGAPFRNAFNYVHWSFDATPTATLTITDGSVTEIIYITNSGPGFLPFEGVAFALNAAVTITLTAGGAGINSGVAIVGARAV